MAVAIDVLVQVMQNCGVVNRGKDDVVRFLQAITPFRL
jgi:hypothetical protein